MYRIFKDPPGIAGEGEDMKHIFILRCPDGRGLVYTSLSEAVNVCQIEGYLACEDYQIERHGYDPVNCSDLGIEKMYNVYGEVVA